MRINDIFYSLQGEGHNVGRAASFVRFAGCNLRCPFCDTEFNDYHEMTAADIIAALSAYPARFVVLTGGEPTLQADEVFVDQLHQAGFLVAMESNGTRPAPKNLDWLTVSPKQLPYEMPAADGSAGKVPDEIKLVFDEQTAPEQAVMQGQSAATPFFYLQPCDTGDATRNAAIQAACIGYIKDHPRWRLSLQVHKIAGFK